MVLLLVQKKGDCIIASGFPDLDEQISKQWKYKKVRYQLGPFGRPPF